MSQVYFVFVFVFVSQVCGPAAPGFAAAGISAACFVEPTPQALFDDLARMAANATAFLALVESPSYGTAALNLSRVALPACCAPVMLPLEKLLWSGASKFFPPNVLSLVRSAYFSAGDISTLLRSAGPQGDYGAAAAAWVGSGAVPVAWLDVLEVTGITPRTGSTAGGEKVVLTGRGFGTASPITASVSIGGAPCNQVAWVADSQLTCTTPPGCGTHRAVEVHVGLQLALVRVTFDYLPAILQSIAGVGPSPAASGIVASAAAGGTDAAAGATAPAVQAGGYVYITGKEMLVAVTMKCRFGGSADVPAVVLSDAKIMCIVPPLPNGNIDVFITNDGVRFSNGFALRSLGMQSVQMGGSLDTAGRGIVWPFGLSSVVPVDFDSRSAPRELTIAVFVLSSAVNLSTPPLNAAMAAAHASPVLLPYTKLNWRLYDAEPVNAAAAGPARDAAIAAAVGAIRADLGASFLGILGPFQSALSIAIATASKASAHPWAQMSPASTNPALSDSAAFPYFVRPVPSDAYQGTALAAVLQRFSTTFVQVGLVDPTRRTIAVIHTDDAYAVGVYTQFVAALSQLASGVLNIGVVVTLPLAAYIAVAAAADKNAYLVNLLAPVCASNDHVIVGIVSTYTTAVLAAGSAACGMTDARFLWVGPDVWLSSDYKVNRRV